MDRVQAAREPIQVEAREKNCCQRLLDVIKRIFRAIGRFLCCRYGASTRVNDISRHQMPTVDEHIKRAQEIERAVNARDLKQIRKIGGTRTINLCADSEIDLAKLLQVGFRIEGAFTPASLELCAKIPSFQKDFFSAEARRGVDSCEVYILVYKASQDYHRLAVALPDKEGIRTIGLFKGVNIQRQYNWEIPINCYNEVTLGGDINSAAFNWKDSKKGVEFEFGFKELNRALLAYCIVLPYNADLTYLDGDLLKLTNLYKNHSQVKKLLTFRENGSAD